ncbi:MAG: redoxin domain-containing protein, partial [Candidatus Zixiibacteriota bacterium]
LASIITLAAANNVNVGSLLITLSYSVGTALPMLAIMYGGRQLLTKVPGLTANTEKIQKAFGILMILTALAIQFNFDRHFQAYILEKFPNYGTGLTKLEDNNAVKQELEKLGSEKNNIVQDLGNSFYPQAPEIIPGGEWFNSKPLKISELKGKVVLIDFWTYTCINCIRTLPYIRDWHSKYKDKGLVIIGVHTPEFEFEKNSDNVARAIKDFGLEYPIVQDNDYSTWRAYNNRFWPAKYFIDRNGKIRSTHFGEGEYDESEKMIQDLLKEAGRSDVDMPINNKSYDVESRTPETYLGYGRIENFVSPEIIKEDEKTKYSSPSSMGSNKFAYDGTWTLTEERARPEKGAKLFFNYESKNVFLVMGSRNGNPG